jgi:hypothetical protein
MALSDLGALLSGNPNIFYNVQGVANNITLANNGQNYVIGMPSTIQNIVSNTAATATVITTTVAHGYSTGDSVTIPTNNGSNASIAGTFTITVLTTTTFSIPVNTSTSGGTGGTVFNNSQPTISVSNINLLAPGGVSGTIDLNTINLFKDFESTTADTLAYEVSILRTRASGEVKTILLTSINVNRNIIDTTQLESLPNSPLAKLTATTGMNVNGGLTGLIGGGSTNLDGIATLSFVAGIQYSVADAQTIAGQTIGRIYVAKNGKPTEVVPKIIVPADNSTSNLYWFQIT